MRLHLPLACLRQTVTPTSAPKIKRPLFRSWIQINTGFWLLCSRSFPEMKKGEGLYSFIVWSSYTSTVDLWKYICHRGHEASTSLNSIKQSVGPRRQPTLSKASLWPFVLQAALCWPRSTPPCEHRTIFAIQLPGAGRSL